MFQTQSRRATSTRAVEALYATGHWLLSQERIAQAIVVFRAMIHVAPHDERGWLALGACHEAREQHSIALELYGAASEVARSTPRCDLARARILRSRGQSQEAIDAIEQAALVAERTKDEDLQSLVDAERRRA
jgi:tetratricopeptide (TPR) repeat protein